MPSTFCDLRFSFQRNPFSSTQVNIDSIQSSQLKLLRDEIYKHPNDYIAVNPMTSIKYPFTTPTGSIKTLCGVKNVYNHTNIDDFKFLSDYIKKFMLATNMTFSKNAISWLNASNNETIDETDDESDNDNNNEEVDELDNEQLTELTTAPDFMPFLDGSNNDNINSSISIGLNYDASNDKKLDYREVCELCLSIATTYKANNLAIKDPAIVAIENKRRRELLNKIQKYRRHREIQAICSDDDISKMSIEQLETLATEYDSKFGQLKLKEVTKQALSTGSKVYDMIFPRGIPIGGDRHLNFNGLGDGIIKELYNTTSTIGLAFDNIIQKHDIKISDELTVGLALATLILQNVTVTKATPTVEDDADDDDNNEEEESSESESAEEDEPELQEV